MSEDAKKGMVITIEAMKSGFVVCTEPVIPGKLNNWHALSTVEDVIVFIEDKLED